MVAASRRGSRSHESAPVLPDDAAVRYTPEPILLPDIERYDLYGEVCSYAPGTSLGARVRIWARVSADS